jgi:ADP-ribose pyrophosphatase YjhB (NUDIX family)
VAGVDICLVDPHFAHLAEGNARQARKRVAADVLIRDRAGRVLVVDPTYKEGWDLPGGMVETNESPKSGASRELREELGLDLVVGRPLVVEWIGAHGPWDDQIAFVFDGGVLAEETIARIEIHDAEIGQWCFRYVAEARAGMREHIWRRLSAAVAAVDAGATTYLERP